MVQEKQKVRLQAGGRVREIPVSRIHPNPTQPRRRFDSESLTELAESIRMHGILQPLSVRKGPDGYELVAGERRWRAARLAGLEKVPCLVVTATDQQADMLALVENLQRRDLDYLEEAEGIARLIRIYGISQEQAAQKLGKSQSAVANKLRLLRHSPAVQEALQQFQLSERHARALLRLEGEEERLAAIGYIAQNDLNVAKTEAYIESRLQKKRQQAEQAPPTPNLKDVRVFLNSVRHHVEQMKSSGIAANAHREETSAEIVLTITIPKARTTEKSEASLAAAGET